MTKQQQAALEAAREHAATVAGHLQRAQRAHADGDDGAVRRHLRGARSAHEKMEEAHAQIERSLEEPGSEAHDPITNPSASEGAQASNGQQPRYYTAEERRQRDQLAGCRLGYDAKMRQMGLRR